MNRYNSKLIVTAVCSCIIAILSISYAVFQKQYYTKKSQGLIRDRYNPHVIGKPLPVPRLIDFSGNVLGDSELRRGKIILVLLSSDCGACFEEGQFLRTIVDKYDNLRFYGVLLFWSDQSIDNIEEKFPMKLFFDDDSLLRQALEVKSFPLKIFLEDGIVKKIWAGTAVTPKTKGAFIKDIDELSNN